MPAKKDPYTILGVSSSSTDDDIRKAYRQLALKWHPDKHVSDGNQTEATKRFKDISEAYQILSDNDRRRDYDAGGKCQSTSGTAKEQQQEQQQQGRPAKPSKSSSGGGGYDWEWSWFNGDSSDADDQQHRHHRRRRRPRHGSGRSDHRTFDAAFEEMERAFDAFGSAGDRQRRRRGDSGSADGTASPLHFFVFKDPFKLFEEFFGRRDSTDPNSDPFTGLFGALMSNPRNQRRLRDELRAEGREGRRDGRNDNNNNDDKKMRKSGGKRGGVEPQRRNVFSFPDPFRDDFFQTAFQQHAAHDNDVDAGSRPGSSATRRQVTSSCSVGGKRVVTKRIVDAKGERIVVEIDGVVTSDTLNGQPVRG